jgi:hypothetical protein
MLLESSAFPFVRMDYGQSGPGGLDASLAAFAALLTRKQAFVLIGHGAGGQQQDHEQRRQLALWMKAHREGLRRFVLALVYIAPETKDRQGAEATAEMYEKFWGYPMLVTSSETQAKAMATALLAEHALAQADR